MLRTRPCCSYQTMGPTALKWRLGEMFIGPILVYIIWFISWMQESDLNIPHWSISSWNFPLGKATSPALRTASCLVSEPTRLVGQNHVVYDFHGIHSIWHLPSWIYEILMGSWITPVSETLHSLKGGVTIACQAILVAGWQSVLEPCQGNLDTLIILSY